MSVVRKAIPSRHGPRRAIALAGLLALVAPGGLSPQDPVALAVTPLDGAQAAAATVIAQRGGEWVTLREGDGAFTCIADDPTDERFQAACYHDSLEPYMARGRELRAEGMGGRASIERRWEEIRSGELRMPSYGVLHQVFAERGWSGDMTAANRLTVIYVPDARAEDLGLPTSRSPGPWLMYPGEPTAHIMIPG